MVVLPENHAFLPKIPILLRPVVKNKHLRLKFSEFYEFGDRYINFFDVLGLLSSSVIRAPWGIVSVKGSVARKSVFFFFFFLSKLQILLTPCSLYAYILERNLQFFTSLMTSISHSLMF